jgi:hypothetical protein
VLGQRAEGRWRGNLNKPVGKRSPILGYNHNVRYRGLVFHVQSEDSGVATPHLFTHLFHHGVIVSTRKLVYDAGSAEESIKSLMQAQHKAVLKDLRRGHFDDKIDSYLGGTPGLLPRGFVEDPDRPGEVDLAPSHGIVEDVAIGAPTEQVLPAMFDDLSAPVLILETTPPPGPPPTAPRANTPPPIPRLPTSERLSAQLLARGPATVDTTLKTEVPTFASNTTMSAASSGDLDLSPEIEIQLELDDNDEAVSVSRRATRDTEINVAIPDETRATLGFDDYTRPTLGMVNEEARRASTISDGIPGAIRPSSPALPPPPPADSRRLDNRPSTINAATLPPARPIARPPARPALSQPQVVSRPATSDDRQRRESDPAEVYSPALASAELPPGERPGQYAQHKKISTKIPIEGLREVAREASAASTASKDAKGDRSGGVAIPAGLGRPPRSGTAPSPNRPHSMTPPAGSPALGSPRDAQTNGRLTEPLRSRTPTPPRIAPLSPSGRAPTGGSSGVVMTRPAVIVGAPAKPATTIPRIRKAREDEGRGFGQGLISEKSLDEVILAYLSEDADEK